MLVTLTDQRIESQLVLRAFTRFFTLSVTCSHDTSTALNVYNIYVMSGAFKHSNALLTPESD